MDKFDILAGKLADAIDPATKAALLAAQTEAASYLAAGVLQAILAALFLYLSVRLWRAASKAKENDRPWPHNDDRIAFGFAGSVAAFLVGTLCAGLALWSFIDPWVWMTLLHPEAYVAKLVLNL